MVAPFGVTILKYTVTISTFHFYLTINTKTFPSFNIIFNRFHKTLVWEKPDMSFSEELMPMVHGYAGQMVQ
ncbi:hypothetical protein CWD58_24925 [Escherichia coli]|nr:hypothetical protein CWD58_24925 [Escherichia coli]